MTVAVDGSGSAEHLSIAGARFGDGILLTLVGELDIASAPLFEAELERAEQFALAVLDLRGLSFMDSSGLHVLINAHRRARDSDRRLVVVQGSPQVDRVLEITGAIEQFEVVADPALA